MRHRPLVFNTGHRYTVDEQAPHLAPEKRDFTATCTLGATMQQTTYYLDKMRLINDK